MAALVRRVQDVADVLRGTAYLTSDVGSHPSSVSKRVCEGLDGEVFGVDRLLRLPLGSFTGTAGAACPIAQLLGVVHETKHRTRGTAFATPSPTSFGKALANTVWIDVVFRSPQTAGRTARSPLKEAVMSDSIPAPADGSWIVRSDIDDSVKARGFVSYEEAREFCAGWDDVYACQYRSAAWDAAFNVLCDRAEKAERSADALDEAFSHTNLSLATDAIGEVDDAYTDICEDDPITRFACYVAALEEAVAQADADYPEVGPCMSFGSSGWGSEAFPKAALGLI